VIDLRSWLARKQEASIMGAKIPTHLFAIVVAFLALGILLPAAQSGEASSAQTPSSSDTSGIRGPFVSKAVAPAVFDGDLRDLPQTSREDLLSQGNPHPPISVQKWPASAPGFVDPVAQTELGEGQMPLPIRNFEAMDKIEGGGWTPPDTVGDVGPEHYVQGVNVGFGIYNKATGAELVTMSFDDLFEGTGTPCDDQNRGDIIVLYDHLAGRWLLSDFSLPSTGPVYQCLAISKTSHPITGGWYFYGYVVDADGSPWHDYPKLGVWPDAYYMTANMFTPWSGAWVWAFNRAAMLDGDPLTAIRFETGTAYGSLLPANLEGPPPPADAPNYLAAFGYPGILRLWEFHVDWTTPANSSFTGPMNLTVADAGLIFDIPQQSPGWDLDSLGDRLMMQLQYRNFDSHEALWVNHTVASGGVAGVRWYEIRDPGGTPYVHQQSTYQPDDLYRWMGSLAVDGDGNMAVGYSVSSENMMPAIRYAGRLMGETPGILPQAEVSLIEGTGVQVGVSRWGDYSSMTVDPVDDCTFWYTQEYYETTGSVWTTRVGSFKFPSCGQPKGWISGTVYDVDTLAGIPNAPVVAEGVDITLSVQTDATGHYSMTLPVGAYDVTAGPLAPAYPDPVTVVGIGVSAGAIVPLDIGLAPKPDLIEAELQIDDNVAGGNSNGYPEPGESGLLLWQGLYNQGAATANNVTAHLTALTPGVTVTVPDAPYPDIVPGTSQENLVAFGFSIAPNVTCGAVLDFEEIVSTDQGVFTFTISLTASVPLPMVSLFSDDMEGGLGNWSTGGVFSFWATTAEKAHSPTHSASDSPYAEYANNTNAWLQSPVFDLSDKGNIHLSFWQDYDMESGWDFVYVEYSLDGGTTWQDPLTSHSGQASWALETLSTPQLDHQPSAAFRFRLQSDEAETRNGWYVDDVELSYEPFACLYLPPEPPTLIAPPNGSITTTHNITFAWEAGGSTSPMGYNMELDGEVITTTNTFSATILDSDTHSWRVRAFNGAGYSDYSDAWMVTIADPPAVPIPLAPADGTVTTTQGITLTWAPGYGDLPNGYNLELDGVVITTTGTTSATMLAMGNHTWRVRAFSVAGYSDYSDAWMVTVEQGGYLNYLPIVLRGQ
jgi:hypothetical protein